MTEQEFNEKLAKIVYLGDSDTKVTQIHTLLKQAGYVQLDDDQSLPKTRLQEQGFKDYDGQTAQQDMLKANFRKVK